MAKRLDVFVEFKDDRRKVRDMLFELRAKVEQNDVKGAPCRRIDSSSSCGRSNQCPSARRLHPVQHQYRLKRWSKPQI